MPESLLAAANTAAAPSFTTTWGIALAVLAAAIAIRVAWSSRHGHHGHHGHHGLKSLLAAAVPAAWGAPAAAIVIAVALQAAPTLDRNSIRNSPPNPVSHSTLVVDGHSWTGRSLIEDDDNGRPLLRTAIASKPHATAEEARREALDLAAQRLKFEVEHLYGQAGDWELSGEQLDQQHFITNQITITRPYKLSQLAPSSPMHHCVVRLEISDASRQWAAGYWKHSVGIERLKTIGTLAGLLCLLVVVAHAYIRLDLASNATHRGKLQLAAVAAVAAAGLVASNIVAN